MPVLMAEKDRIGFMLIKIFIALMVISLLTFVVIRSDMFSNKSTTDALMSAYQSNDKQKMDHEIAVNKISSSLGQIKEALGGADDLQNVSTQEAELLETEDKLMDMVEEYEHVNDDPQLRQSQREKMSEQLSTYSQQVLPVALEKMKKREANKTE